MKALELLREACGVVGIPRPTTIAATDTGVIQLRGLMNEEGRQLSARYGWEGLIREATFVTSAQEDQGLLTAIIGAPNAYRYVLNDTMWNRSRKEPVAGPTSSLDWQSMKTLDLSGPYIQYRIRGGRLLFTPAPAAAESIYFEYVTKNWCTSADGSEQRRAVEDDEDIFLLDDELMLAGIQWRWRKAKSLNYAEDFNGYERLVTDAMGRDATKPRLSLAGRSSSSRGRRVIAPPGSWNL